MRLYLAGSALACGLLASAAYATPDPVIRESIAVCDPNNPTTCQGNTTVVYAGQLTLAAAATPLSTGNWAPSAPTKLVNGLVCKAPATNSGTVYVGPSGVSSSNGYPLNPGEAVSYGPTSAANIYAVDAVTTDILVCTGS